MEAWEALLWIVLGALGAALLIGTVLLALLWRRLRRLRLPAGASYWDTVRAVPLGLVVALDLLDLGLDFLSAPLVWWLLGKLRLQALREVATLQAAVPVTGPVPLLTLSWFLARALGMGKPPDPDVIETERVGPGRYEAEGSAAPPSRR